MDNFLHSKKRGERKVSMVNRQQEESRAKESAKAQNLPYINLIATPIELDSLSLLPEKETREGLFSPFQKFGKRIGVAVIDAKNKKFIKSLEKLKDMGFNIEIFVCSKTSLERAFDDYKRVPSTRKEIVGKIDISTRGAQEAQSGIENISDLGEKLKSGRRKGSGWNIKLLLSAALKFNASDIHIVPKEEGIRIRYRIDGILHDIFSLESSAYVFFLSRMKILSGLKINIHTVAQDGRFSILTEGGEIEVRVSIVPGEYGEDVVMRLLNPNMILTFNELGLHPWHNEVLMEELKEPNGMILVTGPTGSGKTTTLYGCLKKIATPEIKVITIEDPIEYHLEGIAQTQINPDKGYDFVDGLRAAMRQDPDVMLVGEIRDRETADTALQAALTGHLVFSTLHTNDAAGIVPRLIELGSNPSTVAPALNLAIAQRLLRRVCKNCAKKVIPSEQTLLKIEKRIENLPPEIKPDLGKIVFLQAQGCSKCQNTGYKGRIGIFEMFLISEKIEEAILSYPSVSKMRKIAIGDGMIEIQQDGILRVTEGMTTLEELERITGLI